ncbi:MAG: GntR family transcriptional regulator [Clostridiaceae bacterium]|nr:GntR family transcriptional regulator [Clostridiaceae bacterium]
MHISISNTSEMPIYEQIYNQIKAQIMQGILLEGEALPSIRSLAKDLRISVITTKRAYDELEKDGFIYTVLGKGCFVSKRNMDLIREAHLKEIEEYMKKIIELGSVIDLSQEEIIEMFNIMYEVEKE